MQIILQKKNSHVVVFIFLLNGNVKKSLFTAYTQILLTEQQLKKISFFQLYICAVGGGVTFIARAHVLQPTNLPTTIFPYIYSYIFIYIL